MHTILIWFARFFCCIALVVFHGHFRDQNPWLDFFYQLGGDGTVGPSTWHWSNLISLGYGAMMLIPVLFLASSFEPSRRLLQRWSGGESFPWQWGARALGLYLVLTGVDLQAEHAEMGIMGVRVFLLLLGVGIIFVSYPAGWRLITRWNRAG
jgi:hypothetical protein